MKENRLPRAKVAYIGVSLELYLTTESPENLQTWRRNFALWGAELAKVADVAVQKLCFTAAEVDAAVAEITAAAPDAIVLSTLSYTPSMLICPALQSLGLPVVIWSTQQLDRITPDYCGQDLSNNHTVQGIQDITNILYRNSVKFAIVTCHWQDPQGLAFLQRELTAIRAANAGKKIKVLELGGKFEGMGDFDFDPEMVRRCWGITVESLDPEKFAAQAAAVPVAEAQAVRQEDLQKFTVAADLDEATHIEAIRRKLALKQLLAASGATAFTMNFTTLCKIRNFGQLPFYAINTLMAEGMGYAGEGDALRAAMMRQCYELSGEANFTEIYTVDFQRDLMLMSHMQECNINIAGKPENVRLYRKPFWVKGVPDYPGMLFTSQPGKYTLAAITPMPGGEKMRLITFSGEVPELPFLEKYDRPYWLLRPATKSVGELLSAYSLAGGPHHLSAVPGEAAAAMERMAYWLGFDFVSLD